MQKRAFWAANYFKDIHQGALQSDCVMLLMQVWVGGDVVGFFLGVREGALFSLARMPLAGTANSKNVDCWLPRKRVTDSNDEEMDCWYIRSFYRSWKVVAFTFFGLEIDDIRPWKIRW